MKRLLIFLFFIAFEFLPALSDTFNAEISVKTEEIMPYKISNLLFGGFVEFVTNVVDSPTGIWAEDLMDRGFDVCVWDNLATSKYWNTHQEGGGEFKFELRFEGYNPQGLCSQYISAKNTVAGSRAGVYQTIFQNDTVGMDFYIYFRGKINKNTSYDGLYLYIYDTTMTRVLRVYALGKPDSVNWKKSSIKISPTKGYNRVLLMIAIHGDGWVELDDASCMPSDNINGVRKEQYDLLKNWKPGVIRYPGGGFANSVDQIWYNVIGDIDKRKALIVGDRYHRMDFGYDEFMRLCEDLNIEPYFSVRYHGLTVDDAANFVEYCNGGETSKWGKIRAQNGHPNPYKVKYFEIGNEEYYFDPAYATNYKTIHDAMYKKDPTITFISGLDIWGTEENFQKAMDTLGPITQIVANHPIIFNTPSEPATDEEFYISNSTVASQTHWAILRFEQWLNNGKYLFKIKQGSTEWGYVYEYWPWAPFDRVEAGASLGIGIYTADQLFTFIKCANSLVMANITYEMNFIRGGYNKYTNQRVIFGTPSYHIMAMMSNHLGANVYTTNISSPLIQMRAIDGLFNANNYPWVDAITNGNTDTLFVYIINKHPNDSAIVKLDIDKISRYDSLNVYQLASKSYLDANTCEDPNFVVPRQYQWAVSDSYKLPPHSFTILAIPRNYKHIEDTTSAPGVISLNVYPNPANNYINVRFESPNSLLASIKIVDQVGNVMISQNLDSIEINNVIDISMLPCGVYFLRVSCGSKTYNAKIIKN